MGATPTKGDLLEQDFGLCSRNFTRDGNRVWTHYNYPHRKGRHDERRPEADDYPMLNLSITRADE